MAIILANVILLACDHWRMDPEMQRQLETANMIFGFVFLIEAMVKIYAVGMARYLSVGWNRLDLLVVLLFIMELFLFVSNIYLDISFNAMRSLRYEKWLKMMNMLVMTKLNLFIKKTIQD